MEIPGRVRNGVVVLDGQRLLPEGAQVIVSYCTSESKAPGRKKRIQVPLVRTGGPGRCD
jgi:hypothetical protein